MARGVLRWSKRAIWLTGGAIVTVVAVVATVLVVLGGTDAGRFEQRIDARCAPLAVIAFRGSGEANLTPGVVANAGEAYRYGDTGLVTNGWEGITLRGLFDELAHTSHDGFSGDLIPVTPVGPAEESEPYGYDAIDAVLEASSIESALSFSGSRLLHSATRGAEAASRLIQQYLSDSVGCPILPEFVVVGFSQGAMAARHTAELNPDSVRAVVNIGDPYQMPEAPGVRAAGAGGVGIIRWKADERQRELLDAYYDADDLRSSICHGGDPICEFSPIESLFKLATGAYGDHLDYYTERYPDEARDDAAAIVRLAHERWLRALSALDSGEKVDRAEAGNAAQQVRLRSLSMSFAGTPTLVSAFSPDHLGSSLRYEFDLDGDGHYETGSENGLVWLTPDGGTPQRVGVRVTDPATGTSAMTTTTVSPSPDDGEIVFTRDGGLIEPAGTEPEPEDPPVVTSAPQEPPTRVVPVVRPAPVPTPPAPPAPTPVIPAPETGDGGDPAAIDPGPDPAVDPTGGAPGDPGDAEQPGDEQQPGDGDGDGDGDDEEPGPDETDDQVQVELQGVPVTAGGNFSLSGSGARADSTVIVFSQALEIDVELPVDETGWFGGEFEVPGTVLAGTRTITVHYETPSGGTGEVVLEIDVEADDEGLD